MKKAFTILILLIILAGLFSYRVEIRNYWLEMTKPDLPEVVEYELVEKEMPKPEIKEKTGGAENKALPESYNLAVPFTPQAPLADWNETFKEACEEAAALIVHYYYQNKEFTPQLATEEIIKMVDWQKNYFGGHYDLTAEETKEMIQKYLSYERVEIIENPSVDEIKRQLIEKRPVIVPAAGRELGNPYFQTPGPIYHMLVIKGYTKDKFITNDPGTKRGEDFLYNYDTIMAAMHDWNATDINLGAKKVIVIYP
ncbi:MAG TPA: C39 family peptidase [Patescibacteria group bacterium]|nr:C39 family peptidase [Patescibacteria group bacterium]